MKENIVLIGFMATGKTVVGQRLAKKLGMKYISTDTLVEKAARKKISSIFRDNGEKHFRELETKALMSLKGKKGLVVACGGGIVLKAANRAMLKKLGKVFLLTAAPETINKRLKKLSQRPLLDIKDGKKRVRLIASMLKERNSLYKKAADAVIDTEGKSVAQVVFGIQYRYEKNTR